jgi:hypothetical protein
MTYNSAFSLRSMNYNHFPAVQHCNKTAGLLGSAAREIESKNEIAQNSGSGGKQGRFFIYMHPFRRSLRKHQSKYVTYQLKQLCRLSLTKALFLFVRATKNAVNWQ